MWVNPRLVNRLAESYENGDMMRAYGTGGNTYFNNSYNNYKGDVGWSSNNEGTNQIYNFTSNPESLKQQSRFNEITNQWMNEDQVVKANQNLINLSNDLSNSLESKQGKNYPIRSEVPQEMKVAYAEPINDPNYQPTAQQALQKEGFNFDYSTERKFRNGTLIDELHKESITMIVIICVIVFILYMLIQLYISQKRLEYMIHFYRDIPPPHTKIM